jgi:uncharacterized protein related to proFAR isomerase
MSEITFVIAGETTAAEQAAAAVATVLGGADGGVRRIPREQLADVTERVVDPISLAALAVAVPSAIVAALDIADRIMGKRKRAAELVETAQRVRIDHHVEIFVVDVGRVSHAVADLDADKVLDIAEAIERPSLLAPSGPA